MKNAFMISGVAVVGIVIGVFVFIYGGENFSNNTPPTPIENLAAVEVPFTELASGTQSSVSKRTNYLVTSADELEKLWGMIDTKIKIPTVDFNKDYVAAVFAGEAKTSGYLITIPKVEDTDVRTVFVNLTSLDEKCPVAQMITSRYQIIKIPKTSLPFTHKDNKMTSFCTE